MELITLKNGTRIALDYKKDALSAAVNIFIGSGSCCEGESEQGFAHFIEHMVFKGSKNYTAKKIADITDMFGGNVNAYTTKEYTCYLARTLTEHFPKMLELLCDMVCNPLFDKNAVNTEKGVIIEEIGMYEDSPEDLGFDILEGIMWKGSTLDHNILGTRQTVSDATSDSLRSFAEKFYSPERTVIGISGSFDKQTVIDIITRSFGEKEQKMNPINYPEVCFSGGYGLLKKDIEQTHLLYSFPGVNSLAQDRYQALLFTEIAGGGVSSRLNQRIREELGLAYNTYCFGTHYSGCGTFGVCAALSSENQEKFLYESLNILDNMRSFDNSEELYRVKQQLKANTVMSSESALGISANMCKQLLFKNRYDGIEQSLKMIDEVTEEQIRTMANRLFNTSKVAFCVVGEPKKQEFYQKILSEYSK